MNARAEMDAFGPYPEDYRDLKMEAEHERFGVQPVVRLVRGDRDRLTRLLRVAGITVSAAHNTGSGEPVALGKGRGKGEVTCRK